MGLRQLSRRVIELDPQWGYSISRTWPDPADPRALQGGAGELHDREAARCREPTPSNLIDANIAIGLLANDRFPEAIAQARLAIAEYSTRERPQRRIPWLVLIAAESANGQDAEARADLQKFLATPRTWRTMAEIQKFPYFAANPKLLEGLRRAGMPEE